MNIEARKPCESTYQHIKVKHEGRAEAVLVGEDVGLLVQGCIAEVVAHEIFEPEVTRVAEDGAEYAEVPGSMRGVIYGKGLVQHAHHEAFITVGGHEHRFVPHGDFTDPSRAETEIHEPATWKFTFEYSIEPCGCSEK